MKKTITYDVYDKQVEREIDYIPVRYIIAVFITLLEEESPVAAAQAKMLCNDWYH